MPLAGAEREGEEDDEKHNQRTATHGDSSWPRPLPAGEGLEAIA
jgi:hypothetical protein